MQKYKEYIDRMFEVEKDLFTNFQSLHDNYALNPVKFQDQFNKEGERVLQVIQLWENKLCMQSEKGGFSNFTTGLAEKFRDEIRNRFPQIDNIGIIEESTHPPEPVFTLKKINL